MPHQSSTWGSDIISRSTPKKRKHQGPITLNSEEKAIIEKFEESLQKSLTEKAAKSNLSQVAVKSILKFVVTDEDVIDLLRQKENDKDVSKVITYEPKITRSKAKELTKSGSSLIDVKWDELNETKCQVKELLSEDLHEDSSDDEYVPQAEESEDDTSVCCSVSNPPTPSVNQSFLDDEVFKTPKAKEIKVEKCDDINSQLSDDDANIALRTRSKLSFSETPLEQIEQSFVPPDITSDMYDLECNDEDWKNFLSSFTQPLEEVVKNTEEEDLDPEYNILADEEITREFSVDTEELRDDRAVRVPKRELNDLMAELYEYVNIYEKRKDFKQDNLEINIDPNAYPIQNVELDRYIEIFDGASNRKLYLNLEENIPTTFELKRLSTDDPLHKLFSKSQFRLFEQQMCQHVQMLTQNFMLTFKHPYFSEFASELKEYLLNFKLLSEGHEFSTFNTRNLKSALELIAKWEQNFEKNNEIALETIQHFNQVMEESIQCFRNKKHYYLPFPDTIMRIISESDVFLYPQLLPKIPFKHPVLQKCHQWAPFSLSEYTLVALGLEQFVQYLKDNKELTSQRKNVSLARTSRIIQNIIMPARKGFDIYRSINEYKKMEHPGNPISFYFKNKRAPYTVHQVIDLDQFGIVPPNKRPAKLLPRQWRFHIYHTYSMVDQNEIQTERGLVNEPQVQAQESVASRKNLPKNKVPEIIPLSKSFKKSENNIRFQKTYIFQRKLKNCFKRTTPYVKYAYLEKNLKFFKKYFPRMIIVDPVESEEDSMTSLGTSRSMPCLGLSSLLGEEDDEYGQISEARAEKPAQSVIDKEKINEINKNDNSKKEMNEEMNDLMVAGLTLKNVKKEQSIVDKKRAKKRKEYLASIAMLAPFDPSTEKEKRQNFSLAYMKKLKETLGLKDFNKLLEIFIDDKVGDAVDLYRKLTPILIPEYQDLADEFLLFLTAEQACAVGQLIPFFIMNHMEKFLKNLELYFKDQPSQLRKVYKSLQDLSDTPDVNLERIKSTILPLLKSNPLLCDSFLQMFLEESPTTTLLNGAWDVIDVNKELNRAKEEGAFENLVVTDDDSACTCSCHKAEGDVSMKQHCDNCGLRFIQGKVYCQTSKGMKPVNISFPLDPDVDHHVRLAAPNKIRRIDPSSSKMQNSSTKEIMDDGQTNVENDVDGRKRKVRVCKSPKKTPKRKKFLKTKKSVGSPEKNEETSISNENHEKISGNLKETNLSDVIKIEESSPVSKTDWKNLPSPEYINMASSDSDSQAEDETTSTKTMIEERIKLEETQNETISDRWTREEDRILLETFKQNFNKDPISLIKQRLKNRSESEILLRFDNLMTLLQEMYSRGDYKISNS